MRIDGLEIHHVAMPLLQPWRTSYGADDAVHSVLVRMWSRSAEGWGEASPLAAPCYSPEWAGGVFATIREWLGPAILGHDVPSGDDLQRRLLPFKRNSFAKAALDTAWWSLHAQIQNQPLHRLLGASRSMVPVGADFGVADRVEDLLEQVQQAVDEGFPRVKLKFGPGWELPVLRAVRERFPEHPMHIDCNGAYRIDDLAVLRQVDEMGLTMIEQPLQHDDLVDHAKLQALINTPVCLDESITHLRAAQQAVELGSCRYMNIKPGRVGGLTTALAIHDYCRHAQIPCWVGSMLESATGAAHLIALAMLDNFTYPADIFPSRRFYAEDLSDPPIQLRVADGIPTIAALDTVPVPDPHRLSAHTVQSALLTP